MKHDDYIIAILTAIQYHESLSTLNELSPQYQKFVKELVKMLEDIETEDNYEQSI